MAVSVPGGGFISTILGDVGSVVGALVTGHPGLALFDVGKLVNDLGAALNDPTFGFGGVLGSVPGGAGVPTFTSSQTFTALPGGGHVSNITGGLTIPFSNNTSVTFLNSIITKLPF